MEQTADEAPCSALVCPSSFASSPSSSQSLSSSSSSCKSIVIIGIILITHCHNYHDQDLAGLWPADQDYIVGGLSELGDALKLTHLEKEAVSIHFISSRCCRFRASSIITHKGKLALCLRCSMRCFQLQICFIFYNQKIRNLCSIL